MGWKASCMFASTRTEGFLGTFPKHDSSQAHEILKCLGSGRWISAGMASLEQGIYPETGQVYVGAYGSAFVLGTEQVAAHCMSERVPTLVEKLNACLPGSN